jgi:hypothetical protein
LFDADQLGVEPGTGSVHVSEEARKDPAFGLVHGAKVNSVAAGWDKYAPDPKALKRKWHAFLKTRR